MHVAKIEQKIRTAKRFGEKMLICSLLHQFDIKHTEYYFVHNSIKIIFLYKIIKRLDYLVCTIVSHNMSHEERLFR